MGASDHISAFDDDILDMIGGHDSAWVPAVLLEPPLKLSPGQRSKDYQDTFYVLWLSST